MDLSGYIEVKASHTADSKKRWKEAHKDRQRAYELKCWKKKIAQLEAKEAEEAKNQNQGKE